MGLRESVSRTDLLSLLKFGCYLAIRVTIVSLENVVR
jgi:hypothetical protein